MKCPMCDKELPLAHDVDSGRTTLFEHGVPHRCAAHARLVEAARLVVRLYEDVNWEDEPFAVTASVHDLAEALAEVDRG